MTRSQLLFSIVFASISLVGCGDDGRPGTDGGVDTGTGADTGTACTPVTCEIACEHGFTRGADGCEICECAEAPDDSCSEDADCVIARSVTGCCGCERGHSTSEVESNVCLVTRGEQAPGGCYPDPEMCAVVDCAACEPLVRAVCTAGQCEGSRECADGDVAYQGSCYPACAGHDDCTLAADYGNCCGGCNAVLVSFVEGNECWAERQGDTTCAPTPGSCDGLGCPSPANDCTEFGGSAVCMDDGLCREAGADGGCPSGYTDMGGVCVSDA